MLYFNDVVSKLCGDVASGVLRILTFWKSVLRGEHAALICIKCVGSDEVEVC